MAEKPPIEVGRVITALMFVVLLSSPIELRILLVAISGLWFLVELLLLVVNVWRY